MTFIKVCGLTRADDVRAACELGVDAIGYVLWPRSPRYVDPRRLPDLLAAMTAGVRPVGVFVAPTPSDVADARAAGIRIAQIHGVATDAAAWNPLGAAMQGLDDVWVATSLDADPDGVADRHTLILDAHDPVRHGGTGQTIDWAHAARIAARRRVILAGGLTPANVAAAIAQVNPFGVDVSSGIEQQPGIKDAHAMEAFVAAVRRTAA